MAIPELATGGVIPGPHLVPLPDVERVIPISRDGHLRAEQIAMLAKLKQHLTEENS